MKLRLLALSLLISISASAQEEVPGQNTLNRLNGLDKCALVASPGDMLLVYEQNTFGPGLKRLVATKELLSFHNLSMKFGHAEFITDLNLDGEIITHSFYPNSSHIVGDGEPGFRIHDQNSIEYRSNFAIYRVKSSKQLRTRERALEKQKRHEDYWQKGVCSDYVAWLYDKPLNSSWNFIPGVNQVIQFIYPPEAIQTPDNLADSPRSELVCEVVNNKIIFPRVVEYPSLVERLQEDRESKNEIIARHANETLNLLGQYPIQDNVIYLSDYGPQKEGREELKQNVTDWMKEKLDTPSGLRAHFRHFHDSNDQSRRRRELRKLQKMEPAAAQALLNSALMKACQKKSKRSIKRFIEMGAMKNSLDYEARSCLAMAVHRRDIKYLRFMEEQGLTHNPASFYSLSDVALAGVRFDEPKHKVKDLEFYYSVKFLEEKLQREAAQK